MILIHFRIICISCILGRMDACVDIASSLARRGTDMRGRAVPIVEELLVVVSIQLLLVASHDAKDAAAEALPRLLSLVAVVRCMRAAVVTHNTRLFRDIAKVMWLIPSQLLYASSMMRGTVLISTTCPAADSSIARELIVAAGGTVAVLRVTLFDPGY